jgi:uncharacterized protein (DUF849 family)
MLLIAALNGGRSKTAHPLVPASAAELADAARDAGEAGAQAVHFHVRGHDGRESLAPDDVALAVTALRPLGIPFGVSTGAWIISDPVERLRVVGGWTALPDFASVNFDEAGAADLVRHLLGRGVEVEIGIPHRGAAEELVRSGLAPRCVRVMFEPREQVLADAIACVAEAESVLDAGGVACPRLLHGVDATAWGLLDEAVARGYDSRIGFEDALTLPDGGAARSNADLVRAAWARVRSST